MATPATNIDTPLSQEDQEKVGAIVNAWLKAGGSRAPYSIDVALTEFKILKLNYVKHQFLWGIVMLAFTEGYNAGARDEKSGQIHMTAEAAHVAKWTVFKANEDKNPFKDDF